jgi:hypothetical protein
MRLAGMVEAAAGLPWVRRGADWGFRRYAQRRCHYLDNHWAVSLQEKRLLTLVNRASATAFGMQHEFGRIHSIKDFQNRVPLRTYEDFWNDWWRAHYPILDNVTWPGRIPYFALSSGTTSGSTKYIPVSNEMLASNRKAALTSLAWFRRQYPGHELFTGRMFFLGGSTDLTRLLEGHNYPQAGDLSGIAAREVPTVLRAYAFPPLDIALIPDWDRKLALLAEKSSQLPITLVSGVPSWLLVLFEKMLEVTGKKTLAEVWPTLRLVVHGGTKFDPYRQRFRRIIGSSVVQFQETYPASEGFIAAEDPRHQLLRLIPDHGIFFEFVPVEELEKDNPTSHTLGEVELGVQYAVVLTTCAGLWRYVIGDTVSFERRDPPLLRFTGRTKYYLSAFGEHLISEEVERAITEAADATDAEVLDFHIGPVFPPAGERAGHHRVFVEFAHRPDVGLFASKLDESLSRINEDYRAHRAGDLTMRGPEVVAVERGFFAAWLRRKGKMGGQHKVPRMDNTGAITSELSLHVAPAPHALRP